MFSGYRNQKKVLFLVLLLILPAALARYVYSDTEEKKECLFVVKDEFYDELMRHFKRADEVKVLKVSELDSENIGVCSAVAVPYDAKINSTEFIQYYKNGIRVYVYGDLCEEDYRNKILGADKLRVDIKSFGEKFIVKPATLRLFNSSFEERKFNLIAYSIDKFKPLLCDIEGDELDIAISALETMYSDYRYVKKGKPESEYSSSPYYLHLFDKGRTVLKIENTIRREYTSNSYKTFNFVFESVVKLNSEKPIYSYQLSHGFSGDSLVEAAYPKTFTMLPFTSRMVSIMGEDDNEIDYEVKNAVNLENKLIDEKKCTLWKMDALNILPFSLHEFEMKFQTKISTNEKVLNIELQNNSIVLDGLDRQYRIDVGRDKGIIYSYEF